MVLLLAFIAQSVRSASFFSTKSHVANGGGYVAHAVNCNCIQSCWIYSHAIVIKAVDKPQDWSLDDNRIQSLNVKTASEYDFGFALWVVSQGQFLVPSTLWGFRDERTRCSEGICQSPFDFWHFLRSSGVPAFKQFLFLAVLVLSWPCPALAWSCYSTTQCWPKIRCPFKLKLKMPKLECLEVAGGNWKGDSAGGFIQESVNWLLVSDFTFSEFTCSSL